MRQALSAPDDDSHTMVMDGHQPLVDLQARHLGRRPHLEPAHPARFPWRQPVSVASYVTSSDFDSRRAERVKLRPGGQDNLAATAATAQQPPVGVGQFQPVRVQAGSTTDSPAQEDRGRHAPIPIEGESDVANAAAQPRDLGWRGTVEQADALFECCVRHGETLQRAYAPAQVLLSPRLPRQARSLVDGTPGKTGSATSSLLIR